MADRWANKKTAGSIKNLINKKYYIRRKKMAEFELDCYGEACPVPLVKAQNKTEGNGSKMMFSSCRLTHSLCYEECT